MALTFDLREVAETEKEFAHTDVYFMGTYIGYYLKNRPIYREGQEPNYFVSCVSYVPCIHAKDKADLLNKLAKEFSK